jgi:hypothetical protein
LQLPAAVAGAGMSAPYLSGNPARAEPGLHIANPSAPAVPTMLVALQPHRIGPMEKLKSSRLWAQEMFHAVRGREAKRGSEADEWVVRMLEHFIARIKREAFVAGADRYKNRLLSLAPHEDHISIKQVPLLEPSLTPAEILATLNHIAKAERPLPRISSEMPAATTPVTPAMTKACM